MIPANTPEEILLPWEESPSDRRFKRTLVVFVTIFLLISVIVPFIPVPDIVQKDLKTVAPRISRLIMEKKKQPPPPKPEVKKKIKKEPVKKKKVIDKKAAAHKKAASSGLVALSSELADLRESFDFPALDKKPLKKSKLMEKQDFNNDLITAKATSSSAGIDTTKLTSSISGAKLSGRSTTKVTSEIANKAPVAKKSKVAGRKSSRSENEIEQVFQKNKGVIYNIYNRALRKDSTLEGKVVVEITIDPSGKVIQCKVISSELGAPDLERKIVARIKMFKFKPADVLETTVKYPIDFLPS